MIKYNTIDEYLQHYKEGDIIVLNGRGIIEGIKTVSSKLDTYKVQKGTTKDKILLKAYRGKKILSVGANYYDQQIAVLSNKEFKQLN